MCIKKENSIYVKVLNDVTKKISCLCGLMSDKKGLKRARAHGKMGVFSKNDFDWLECMTLFSFSGRARS